jgi:hypothetical protein
MSIFDEPLCACVYCEQPTCFGSGKFVNRIPAGHNHELPDGTTETRDGYACAECTAMECDRCNKTIPHDEEITPYDVFGEDYFDKSECYEFFDEAYHLCEECLTPAEKTYQEETYKKENTA